MSDPFTCGDGTSPTGGVGGGGGTPTGTSTPPPWQIACDGAPTDCKNVPCSGSPETISDIFPNPGDHSDIRVDDVNTLWANSGATSVYSWGWMYQGSNGLRYVQINYANKAQWSAALSVSLGKLFGAGGGVATPGGYSDIKQWNGSLPPGTFPKKCESKGATLV